MFKNEYLEECIIEGRKGNLVLISNYVNSKDNQCEQLRINDIGFLYNSNSELKKFKQELINANIKEFILTESSTALMTILSEFNECGIKIVGTEKIKYIDRWDKKECFQDGLELELNSQDLKS